MKVNPVIPIYVINAYSRRQHQHQPSNQSKKIKLPWPKPKGIGEKIDITI